MNFLFGPPGTLNLHRMIRDLFFASCGLLVSVSNAPAEPLCRPELRTTGVNYDPREVLPPGSLGHSTATLSFEVEAQFGGIQIVLSSGT